MNEIKMTMTAEALEEMKAKINSGTLLPGEDGTRISCIYVGKLCFEVVLMFLSDPKKGLMPAPFFNCYGLGIDQGYGETESGIPYDFLDTFDAPTEMDTLEAWNNACVEKIEEILTSADETIKALGAEPLAAWE